ncbi:hypothetical protein PXK58_08190 [Phaeobacter gallaeciensis]|uniref:hypothetical protein n=1 Tax=Phaeobacter gallaeciensis TaxID=60890 RepID=UPI00238019DF|nr:hypothetical protein [Phaeobacter gallaeciensis]MDE4274290.1 hypothetical protein [Phaeobacter gallaeciensis]MDE4299530.1 hypothetical protein [Phaeobacter gallaeciensis]MDE5184694.1 hypothetical protein [Phaeobacter gallaeciensis]
MSEPVTQAEIEDVLSSIRRLVSEDDRKGAARVTGSAEPASPEPAEPRSEKAATRLVLTPALRVSEAKPEAADPIDTAYAREVPPEVTDISASSIPAVEVDTDLTSVATDETDAGAAGQAVEPAEETPAEEAQSTSDEDATDAAEDAPWKDPWATLYQAAGVTGVEGFQDASDEVEAQSEASLSDAMLEEIDPADRVFAVVQKITELEAKVARSEEQWEPDGRSSDPYAGTNVETLQWQDHHDEDLSSEEAADAHEEVVSWPDSDISSGAGDDAETAVEAETEDPARGIAEEAITAETLDALTEEDSYLDEDSLRELVAEIVREELQGALGERITRNVRKLVRREIHRALAAQDLL